MLRLSNGLIGLELKKLQETLRLSNGLIGMEVTKEKMQAGALNQRGWRG